MEPNTDNYNAVVVSWGSSHIGYNTSNYTPSYCLRYELKCNANIQICVTHKSVLHNAFKHKLNSFIINQLLYLYL